MRRSSTAWASAGGSRRCTYRNSRLAFSSTRRRITSALTPMPCSASASRGQSAGLPSTSLGFSQSESTGVLIASGSPLRSMMLPRCAASTSVRTVRASPCRCRTSLSSTCRCRTFHTVTETRANIAMKTKPSLHSAALPLARVSFLATFDHHHFVQIRRHHLQLGDRPVLDPSLRHQTALLQQQTAPFNLQEVALLLQLLQLVEQQAALVRAPHHAAGAH